MPTIRPWDTQTDGPFPVVVRRPGYTDQPGHEFVHVTETSGEIWFGVRVGADPPLKLATVTLSPAQETRRQERFDASKARRDAATAFRNDLIVLRDAARAGTITPAQINDALDKLLTQLINSGFNGILE